jgi:hypothetical protein
MNHAKFEAEDEMRAECRMLRLGDAIGRTAEEALTMGLSRNRDQRDHVGMTARSNGRKGKSPQKMFAHIGDGRLKLFAHYSRSCGRQSSEPRIKHPLQSGPRKRGDARSN